MGRPSSLVVVTVMFGFWLEGSTCFPNGAVDMSCASLTPKHPPFSSPQDHPAPYRLLASNATYRPGDAITVTLEGVNSSVFFAGFLLQARQVGVSGGAVGRFTNINTQLTTPLRCNDIQNSSVSHVSAENKPQIRVTWEAPADSKVGDVHFSATFVQNYRMFWCVNSSTVARVDKQEPSAAPTLSACLLTVLGITVVSLSVYN